MFRIIVPIILIIVSGLVGFFYILPLYENVMTARDEGRGIDDALQKTKDIGDIAEELRGTVEGISSSDLDKLEVILPKDVDEIRFLNMLNSIARRNNLALEGLTVKSNLDEKGNNLAGLTGVLKPVPLDASFSVFAPYETFQVFLKDLEQSLALIDVQSITLSVLGAVEGEEVTDSYIYKVNLSTYLLE